MGIATRSPARRRSEPQGTDASLARKAYEVLADRIVALELAPGSPLIENQLLRALGMSRTPIREALHRLAQEGLVVHVPSRGMKVADILPEDFQQVCEFRSGTEGMAARLAAQRMTGAQLSDLLGIQAAIEHTLTADDARQFVQYDRSFHHLLAEASQNRFLVHSLTRTYNVHLRLWYYLYQRKGGLRQTGEEHLQLIEALKHHDPDAAEQAMRGYITRIHDLMRQLF